MARSQSTGDGASAHRTVGSTPAGSIAVGDDDISPVAWTSALARPGEAPSSRVEPSYVLRRLLEISIELTHASGGGVAVGSSGAWLHLVAGVDDELRPALDAAATAGVPLPDGTVGLHVPVLLDGRERIGVVLVNRDRPFSPDDEVLVERLAAVAAAELANARMFDELAFRERWATALNQLTGRALRLDDIHGRHLGEFVDCACQLGEADLGLLAVRADDLASFVVLKASGLQADRIAGMRYSLDGTLTQHVVEGRQPRIFSSSDLFCDLGREVQAMLGSIAAVPFVRGAEHAGLLLLARSIGRPPLTGRQLEMCTSFADQLASLVGRVRSAAGHDSAIVEDRARIARDLHEHVIHQLFGVAVGLEAAATTTEDPAAAERITRRVEEIDEAIVAIRRTVFDVAGTGSPDSTGLRERLFRVVDEAEERLALRPGVTFVGPIDDIAAPELADDVCAVVTQGLATVAERSDLSSVGVVVTALEARLLVELVYDGRGQDLARQRLRALNLQERAAAHGGDLTIEKNHAGGMTLTWSVPVERRSGWHGSSA